MIITNDRSNFATAEFQRISAAVSDSSLSKTREYCNEVDKSFELYSSELNDVSERQIRAYVSNTNNKLAAAQAVLAGAAPIDADALITAMEALPDPEQR